MNSSNAAAREPIAIVGMGCRFPGSPNIPAYWRTVRDGLVWSGPVPRSRWNHDLFYSETRGARDHNKTYVNRVSLIEEPELFAPDAFGVAPRRARIMDPQQRLFLDVVRGALEDAGYAHRPLARDRVGTFVGACMSDFMSLVTVRMRATLLAGGEFGDALAGVDVHNALTRNVAPLAAHTVVGSLLNMIAANVNQSFDFGGPAFTTDAACSSALVALNEAILHLRHGQCDLGIVGGVYMVLSPDNVLGFARIGAVSASNTCRPFDQRADGFVVGEGLGAVICKRLSDAISHGDRVYAVIRGMGINNDGRGDGPMTPRQGGQTAVLERAYADSGVNPNSIELIEAHGTATPVGDATEVAAIAEFRSQSKARPCAMSSAKANVGHSMSAAGIAGLIRAALCVHHGKLPKHAGYGVPRDELKLESRSLFIPSETISWPRPPGQPRRAGVNSFGFGGTNCHVVLEEAGLEDKVSVPHVFVPSNAPSPEPLPELFLLSAPTRELLACAARDLLEILADKDAPDLVGTAYTLAKRAHADFRAAFVAATTAELTSRLNDVVQICSSETALPLAQVWVGEAPQTPAGVAFLFPGQGAQSLDLARDIYERFPFFRNELERLTSGVFVDERPLLSFLYPRNGARSGAKVALTRTAVCQPIMAALGLALAAWMERLGVSANAVAGHSLGDFSAAAHAGVLGPAEAVQLVAKRGNLIAQLDLPDPGAMLAVSATPGEVAASLADFKDVVVANVNHPHQVVIAGPREQVSQAGAALTARGFATRSLNVSHAFHSPFMHGIRDAFSAAVARLTLAEPRVPLFQSISPAITSMSVPVDAEHIRAAWATHATSPVDFVSTVLSLRARGTTAFLQMGGGRSLANMARRTLGTTVPECHFIALTDDERENGCATLEALAQLFCLGAALSPEALFEGRDLALVSLPPSRLRTRPFWPVKRDVEATSSDIEPAPIYASSQMIPKDQSLLPQSIAPVSQPTKPNSAEVDLVSLFAQQMAVLDVHASIIKQQNQLLLRNQTSSQPTAPVLPQDPTAPVVVDPLPAVATLAPSLTPVGVDAKVCAAVARITATPVQQLLPGVRLGADLGFDSLMVTELSVALSEDFPGLTLPRSVFATDLSLDLLCKAVESHLVQEPALEPTQQMVRLYRPIWRSTQVRAPISAPIDDAAIVIHGDHEGLGPALARVLEAQGRRVVRSDRDPGSVPSPAHVIDLSTLTQPPSHDVSTTLLQVIGDLHSRVAVRPVSWRLLRRTSGTAGINGLVRSLRREYPDVALSCLEIDDNLLAPQNHQRIIQELVHALANGSQVVECRWVDNGSGGVDQQEPSFEAIDLPRPGHSPDGVVVISGATGSIGRRLAVALARPGAALGLLGRKAAADPSVVLLLKELSASGAVVSYQACDIRNAAAVNAAIVQLSATLGPIGACVHAAGAIHDQAFEKVAPSSSEHVVESKLRGAQNLWHALQGSPLRVFVALGSWAGRFGNAHQSTYAAANAGLESLFEQYQAERPVVRCCVLELPAWRGTAMVESLPQAVRTQIGSTSMSIDDDQGLLVLQAGLLSSDLRGTFVVGSRLPAQVKTFGWVRSLHIGAPGYLADHVIAGRPVLPLAGAVDFMLAAVVNPDRSWPIVLGNIEVVEGIVLEGSSATARVAVEESGGETKLELVRLDGRRRVGFRARLKAQAPGVPALNVEASNLPTPMRDVHQFYQESTFHGPGLQAIAFVDGLGSEVITGEINALPVDGGTPIVATLDGVLQLFGFWATQSLGFGGLPLGIGCLAIYRMPVAGERLRVTASVAVTQAGSLQGDADLVDASGAPVLRVRGFQGEQREVRKSARHVADKANGNGQATKLGPVEITRALSIEDTQVDQFPEVKELSLRIAAAENAGMQIPYFRTHDGINAATASVSGKDLINFSSYNYLGFSGHPEVAAAAKAAIDTFGSSVSASRIASGQRPLHQELEQALAGLLGSEDALVMVGGHATNVSIIGHLLGPEDLVVHDSLAHDSILGGARLSGAKRRPFAHNDVDALERILRDTRQSVRRVLIAVEGVYSMDGDMAPLDRIVRLKQRYGALLLVDEAHSIGVLGARGAGIGEHFKVDRKDVDLWMGTLSKSFASCGGYVTGTRKLIEYLRYTVPGFIYSVGISPPNAAAALTSIRLMLEQPEIVARLQERSRLFLNLCQERGINTGMSQGSAVVPCIVGNSMQCMQLSQALLVRGYNVQPILYPAVEENQARLRFFVSATHSEEQLRHAAKALAEELARLQGPSQLEHPPPRALANGG